MKNLIKKSWCICLSVFVGILALSIPGKSADTIRIDNSSVFDSTADNYSVAPDSFTVTTVTATLDGTERFFQNLGPNDLFLWKSSVGNVRANGIKLSSGTIYIEDQWMGQIYFQVEADGSPCDLRIENKKIQ